MTTKLWIATLATLGLFGAHAAYGTNAEPGDADDRTLAKTARARAKMSNASQAKSKGKDGGDENSSCDLNIGNVTTTRPGTAPKEIIVVVQGDVINANNKCK
jgi:hypothetical protein